MELEFETRTTDYLRQSIEGVCRQEQTQEVIVPDTSPDASRVVYCCAQAVVRSREGMNGAVHLITARSYKAYPRKVTCPPSSR